MNAPRYLKTHILFATILFFAPFVHATLSKLALSTQEKNEINGYVTYGYINIFAALLSISFSIAFYITRNTFFDTASQIISRSILIGIGIQVWRALSNKQIQNIENIGIEEYKGSSQDILMSFLPGYNVHLRYNIHNYDKPNRRLKEGVIRTYLIALSSGLSITLFITVLIGYIIRTITLLTGKDIIPNKIKLSLNTLFKVNPEEILAYITGTVRFFLQKITKTQETWIQNVEYKKNRYQNVLTRNLPEIHVEYGIGMILMLRRVRQLYTQSGREYSSGIKRILPSAIFMRYIGAYYSNQLPLLPFIHEMSSSIMSLFKKTLSKNSLKSLILGVGITLLSLAGSQTRAEDCKPGPIDLKISQISLAGGNTEAWQGAPAGVTLMITNVGNGCANTNAGLEKGFITCTDSSNTEIFRSGPIPNLTILPGKTITLDNLLLLPSATQNIGNQTLKCQLNLSQFSTSFGNSTFVSTAIQPQSLNYVVREAARGRFDLSINKSINVIQKNLDAAIPTQGAEGVRDLIFRILQRIVIPLVIVAGVLAAILGLYKVMTSTDDKSIQTGVNYILRGTVGIIIMMSAQYLGTTVYQDIFGSGKLTVLSGVQLAQDIYEKIAFPFLKLAIYLIVGILFIILLSRVYQFITNPSEVIQKQAINIIAFTIVGTLVILGSKEIVETVYGTQQQVINKNATDLGEIGVGVLQDKNIEFYFAVINWILGIITFVILILIIGQVFALLTNPDDSKAISKIRQTFLYMFIGVMLIGAVYLITNFFIIN